MISKVFLVCFFIKIVSLLLVHGSQPQLTAEDLVKIVETGQMTIDDRSTSFTEETVPCDEDRILAKGHIYTVKSPNHPMNYPNWEKCTQTFINNDYSALVPLLMCDKVVMHDQKDTLSWYYDNAYFWGLATNNAMYASSMSVNPSSYKLNMTQYKSMNVVFESDGFGSAAGYQCHIIILPF